MTPLNYAAGVCVEIREWGWGAYRFGGRGGGVAGLACHPAIYAALAFVASHTPLPQNMILKSFILGMLN